MPKKIRRRVKPRSRNDGRVKEHRPEWDSSTDVPTRAAPTVEIHGTAAAGSANSWNSPFAGTYYDVRCAAGIIQPAGGMDCSLRGHTHEQLILKEAEQMRNFSLAGGMSGIITQESSRPPRASSSRRKQRKKARRPQRNQGFDPLAQVTEKLNRASAEAITGPFVQPGDWQPTMGQPPRSPFRNVYSAFGSSTASPRHGQQESGWLWFGREVDQPPSATAAAEVIKRSTSVPNPLAARATPQDRLSARPATAGSTNASSLGQHAAVTPRRRSQDQASSGSLRAWKRSDEPLSGQRASSAHGTRRLRRLPPKGRADLAVYSPQRARSASGRRRQHRRWPQAAFAGTRATLLDVPKHGVALAHKVDERVFVPSPQQYDADRPWRTGVLARAKSAPSYTVGKRLKSKHEMALATGHTDPPAPGVCGLLCALQCCRWLRWVAPRRRTSQGAFVCGRIEGVGERSGTCSQLVVHQPPTMLRLPCLTAVCVNLTCGCCALRALSGVWPQAGFPTHNHGAFRIPRRSCSRRRRTVAVVCQREQVGGQGCRMDSARRQPSGG